MRFQLAVALLLAAACTPSRAPREASASDASPPAAPTTSASPATAPAPASPAPAANEPDSNRIARLEREARALAHTEACAAGACRTAPVGSRPCGGPRTYLVYCASATDSAALFAKLDELARAEQAFNSASGMASTCEYRMPPGVAIQGGRCVATASELPAQ